MFLHLSVSHSVQRGGVSASVHAGIHTSTGRHPPRQNPSCPVHAGIRPSAQCMLGYTPLPSACWDTHIPPPSACWDTPPVHAGIDMATATDGTHLTGMHSCNLICNDDQQVSLTNSPVRTPASASSTNRIPDTQTSL